MEPNSPNFNSFKFNFAENIIDFINQIDGIFIQLDKTNYKVFSISKTVEEILGYTVEEVLNEENWFLKNLHIEDRKQILEEYRMIKTLDINQTLTYRFRNKQGKYIWIKNYSASCKDYILSLWFDITQEKIQEEKAIQYFKIIQNIYKSIPQGIILVNTNNFKIIEYKPTTVIEKEICSALGVEVNKSLKEIFSPEIFAKISYFIDKVKQLGTIEEIEITLNILNIIKYLSFTFSKINENEVLIVVDDITKKKEAEDRLKHLAFHDPLTGLPNRKYLFEQLSQLIIQAYRHNRKVAVVFLDLDNFKDINDSYGHDIGDLMLISIAENIKYSLRPGDIIGRIGGDEFIIILDDVAKLEDINIIINKIQKGIESAITQIKEKLGIDIIKVSCSMGISIYPDDSQKLEELIKFADIALYQAKEIKNTFVFYSKEITSKLEKRIEIIKKLNEAIKDNEFVNYYQPLFDLSKIDIDKIDFKRDILNLPLSSIIGFEALIRWIDKNNNIIPPLEFIPIAEETGLIIDIGKIVFKNGLQDFIKIKEILNQEFRIFFNISPKEFENPYFKDNILKTSESFNTPLKYISFEITESLVMKNIEKYNEISQELISKGAQFCIDDFGTGYSSLSYLVNLNINLVKIDKTFIKNIGNIDENLKNEKLIRIIIEISKSLGLKVLAEGVETVKQLKFLKSVGCDLAQGFLFAKPMPLNQLIYFISNLENY